MKRGRVHLSRPGAVPSITESSTALNLLKLGLWLQLLAHPIMAARFALFHQGMQMLFAPALARLPPEALSQVGDASLHGSQPCAAHVFPRLVLSDD
jgi:hypothetical protein